MHSWRPGLHLQKHSDFLHECVFSGMPIQMIGRRNFEHDIPLRPVLDFLHSLMYLAYEQLLFNLTVWGSTPCCVHAFITASPSLLEQRPYITNWCIFGLFTCTYSITVVCTAAQAILSLKTPSMTLSLFPLTVTLFLLSLTAKFFQKLVYNHLVISFIFFILLQSEFWPHHFGWKVICRLLWFKILNSIESLTVISALQLLAQLIAPSLLEGLTPYPSLLFLWPFLPSVP